MSYIYQMLTTAGVSADVASWGTVIFFGFCLLCIFFAFKRLIQGKR